MRSGSSSSAIFLAREGRPRAVSVRVGMISGSGLYSRAPSQKAPACNHWYVIHDHADRPDIAFDAIDGLLVKDQLRSHVEHRTHTCAIFLIVLLPQLLRKPKVRQLGSITLDEYVLSLDVPMSDVLVIKQAGSVDDVPKDTNGL